MTISGLIDTAYIDTNYSGATADTKGLAANGSATTVLTVAGTEDLGGGLAANFQFQITPDFINGAGVAAPAQQSQQTFVGLSGNFGQVQVGRINSNALDAWGVGSAFGTAIGSGYGSNGNIFTRYSAASATAAATESAPTRFNGAVRYISPSFNGFTASALIVPKKQDSGAQSVTDIGLRYSNGPLNVAFASQEVKDTGGASADFVTGLGTNEKSKLNILSGNYTIGAATLLGGYWTEKLVNASGANTTDAKGYMIGGKYVIGATTLLANYGKNDSKLATPVDKKITGIGADYALSKRTNLYARWDKRSSTGSEDITRTAIGVRHTF